jgi:hypothetical protein
MLVQINTDVGGISNNEKSRFFNFMSCLHAVATATAGSTPVVNPVAPGTAVKNTSYNCITVLSNAEAGGWTAGNSNNITAATTYDASFSSPYLVDLFNYTGKTTYPYYRMTFGNQNYAFNSSFDSYPWMSQWAGHTSNNPATTSYNSDTNYYNGSWSSGRNSGGSTSIYSLESYPSNIPMIVGRASQTIYVSVTATYMIIATPYDIFYFGQRTIAPWELTRADNPPWVSFGWSGGQGITQGACPNGQQYTSHYQAWTSTVSPDGSYTTTPAKLGTNIQTYSYGQGPNTLCGVISTNNLTWSGNYTYFNRLQPATHPLAHLFAGFNMSYNTPLDGVLTDSATGQTVPAAYPLMFRAVNNVNSGTPATSVQSAIGVFQGILRGPSTTNSGYTTMMTSSEYQIGTSTYIPIRLTNGNVDSQDCFWIRKA